MSNREEIVDRIEQLDREASQAQRSNPERASQLWQSASRLAVEIDHYVWMARIQRALGTCSYLMSDEQLALKQWESAIRIGRAHGAYRAVAMSYINIGNYHALRGYNHTAMKSYDAANQVKDRMLEELPDAYVEVDHQIRVNMATVLNRIGEHKDAIACLRPLTEADEVYEKSRVAYYNQWGWAHASTGNEAPAIEAYEKAIEIAKEKKYVRGLGIAYGRLADLHQTEGRYVIARRFYQKARELFDTFRDTLYVTLALSHVALAMDELDTAEQHLVSIDPNSLADNYSQDRVSYFDAYRQLHKKRNDLAQALEASEAQTGAILALDKLESQRQFADMKTNVEFELLEHERRQTDRERRQLATLNRQKDMLLEKMDVILSVFDHDLRNIIAAPALIIGVMQMKIASLKQVTDHKDALYLAERINDISGFISEVIDIMDLLSYVREFENEKHEIRMEAVSVSDVVDGCITKQMRKAEAKSIQLEYQSIPPSWFVTADPILLDRVLHNLVTNAIKYTPKGDKRTIKIRAEQRDDAIDISVCDEGQGLTDDDKRKLFTIGRLSARPTDGEATTGLGLYLTRQLTRMMRGEISADSPGRDQGSIFTVTLPQVNINNHRQIGA